MTMTDQEDIKAAYFAGLYDSMYRFDGADGEADLIEKDVGEQVLERAQAAADGDWVMEDVAGREFSFFRDTP